MGHVLYGHLASNKVQRPLWCETSGSGETWDGWEPPTKGSPRPPSLDPSARTPPAQASAKSRKAAGAVPFEPQTCRLTVISSFALQAHTQTGHNGEPPCGQAMLTQDMIGGVFSPKVVRIPTKRNWTPPIKINQNCLLRSGVDIKHTAKNVQIFRLQTGQTGEPPV